MARGNQVYWFKENGIDQYVSVNTFSGFQRRETKVFELKNFYLDIDFKLVDINPSEYIDNMKFVYDYADKVVGRCYELGIPIPTQINFSGNGLHVYWEIRNINERGDDGKKLYHANGQECNKVYKVITNRLIELFEDLGADPNAKGISRVLRIENTINSKNNLECKKVFLSKETTTIKDMAVILDYTLDEVKEFYNQPATDKQKALANKLNIEIEDNKWKALNKLKRTIKRRENYYLKRENNLPWEKENNNDYLLRYLVKLYDLNYISRGNGITNNFFYLLGIGCKRAGVNSESILYKYLDLLVPTTKERKEMKTSYYSGFNSKGHYLNISYDKINDMLKVDAKPKTIKEHKIKRKRNTKEVLVKVYNKMNNNRKYVLSKSCRKLAKKYNISKNKANEFKKRIIELINDEEKQIIKARKVDNLGNTINYTLVLPIKELNVFTTMINIP